MSKSAKKSARHKKLEDFLFDDWIVNEFERTGGFTALVVLVATSNLGVVPLSSTFMHVIGDELDWHHFSLLVRGAGVPWDGVLLMPAVDEDGGPIEDAKAKEELRALEERINENRLVINEGHFFDKWGRRMKVEPAEAN